jgi:hypothetical protein
MELGNRRAHPFPQPRPIVPCAQCGDRLTTPEWSEGLDDCRIRHLWSCRSCGYRFEALVRYPAPVAAGAGQRRD